MIGKEAWSFYRTISGVRLCWELEEPNGPKASVSGSLGRLVGAAQVPPRVQFTPSGAICLQKNERFLAIEHGPDTELGVSNALTRSLTHPLSLSYSLSHTLSFTLGIQDSKVASFKGG